MEPSEPEPPEPSEVNRAETEPSQGATNAPPAVQGGEDGSTATPRRAPLDERGLERPAFLLGYPEDPALERLIRAFEAGNYALVRREAEPLAARTDDPAVRDAALELRRRIDPDPLAKRLLLLSVLLLAFLVVWAYTGSH